MTTIDLVNRILKIMGKKRSADPSIVCSLIYAIEEYDRSNRTTEQEVQK